MKRNVLRHRGYRILSGLLIVFGIMLFLPKESFSQPSTTPFIPNLSLTKGGGLDAPTPGWDKTLYPDGRIWLPPSQDGKREFLLPVYIDNRWIINPQKPLYIPDPIKSFRFTLLYDGSAMEAVGWDYYGDNPAITTLAKDTSIAKDFQITMNDVEDKSYVWNKDHSCYLDLPEEITSYYSIYLDPCDKNVKEMAKYGRAVTIAGSSFAALPPTSTSKEAFKVLIYVKFRLKNKQGSGEGSISAPIMFDERDIRYNDVNIRRTNAFYKLGKLQGKVTSTIDTASYSPFDVLKIKEHFGLAGINNQNVDPNLGPWKVKEHSRKGMVHVMVTDRIPKFEVTCFRGAHVQTQQIKNIIADQMVEFSDPITVDVKKTYGYNLGSRIIQLKNKINGTRMLNVEIESSEPWLKFRRADEATLRAQDINSLNGYVVTSRDANFAKINRIDNGILGTKEDMQGNPTSIDAPIYLGVKCDLAELANTAGVVTGKYVGYLTFKSPTAEFDNFKLRVTFIVYEDPNEIESVNKGVRISFQNIGPGKTVNGQDTTITYSSVSILGTGDRASTDIDVLYGETAYNSSYLATDKFMARWIPTDSTVLANCDCAEYGLYDMLPNDDDPASQSRDIRDANSTEGIHVFHSKLFNRSINDVVVKWHKNDIDKRDHLFMRDSTGLVFLVDMVNGGVPSPTSTDTMTFTLENPEIKDIWFEFSNARKARFTDEDGNNIIKKGWNLLSVPLRPTDLRYQATYKNAKTKPYFRTSTVFAPNDNLKVGVGFFIKYNEDIDSIYSGAIIHEISRLQNPVELFPQDQTEDGWNLVGALSTPKNVGDISFDPNPSMPDKNYSLKYGIYGYKRGIGYYEVSILRPGFGYWLKVDKRSFFKIKAVSKSKRDIIDNEEPLTDKAEIYNASTKLIVRDNAQNEGSLYINNRSDLDLTYFELPPVPPTGYFDARFTNKTVVANSDEAVITLNSETYPLAISLNNANADYTFTDAYNNNIVFGSITRGNDGVIEIPATITGKIRVKRTSVAEDNFSLSINQNPVDANATISYNLPTSEFVTVKVYDMMGNEVANLCNETKAAGENYVNFNAAGLSSGAYICKVIAGANHGTLNINVVK